MEVYAIIVEETCNALYLDGLIEYKNIIQKLFRGYKQQIITMLKFTGKYYDQKNIKIDDLSQKKAADQLGLKYKKK